MPTIPVPDPNTLQSAWKWKAITPSNTTDISPKMPRAFWIGVGGDVVFVGQDDVAVTFKNISDGTLLVVAAKRVNATNTTASSIVALY